MTTTGTATQLDRQCIATIRAPCIDAIQVANSTTALYSRFGWRGLDQFAHTLLSAMRNEFGGHSERRG